MQLVVSILCIALMVGYPIYAVYRERSVSSVAFLLAMLVTSALAIMDLFIVGSALNYLHYKRIALFLEGAQGAVWLLASLMFMRDFSLRKVGLTQRILILLSVVPMVLVVILPLRSFFYSPDFSMEPVLFLERSAWFFYLQVMLFLAIALFNFEATVANAGHGNRWKVKFAIIGAGFIVGAHVLYFSQSLIVNALDMTLVHFRIMACAVGVALVAYSQVRRGADVRIIISKSLAYRSVVMLFSGLFLVVLGILGEGMKHFGEDFNRYLIFMLGLAACVGVLVASMSDRVRRKFRVMIQRNFYKEKYDYRVQWKAFTERLSEARSREALYRSILSGYCETFGIVGGTLYLRNQHSDEYVAASFLEMDENDVVIPQSDPLIEELGNGHGVIDLRGAGEPRDDLVGQLLVGSKVTFIVPVKSRNELEGLIMLSNPINPGEEYDFEDFELMEALALQVGAAVTNIKLGDELVEAREMEVIGRVATFVLHDLKNQVYPLSLLVENAREYIDEPEFQQDMLASLESIVTKMKVLISQLTHIPKSDNLKRENVDLRHMVDETVELVPDAGITVNGEGITALIDATEVQKVVLNLLLNAIEAGEGKPITATVGQEDGPYIEVVDQGTGIDEQMLKEGLFTPFKTTKVKGMGIGLFQCKQIIEAHGGTIEVFSQVGEGATFVVRFPDQSDG